MTGRRLIENDTVFRYWDYPRFGVLTLLNLGTAGFAL